MSMLGFGFGFINIIIFLALFGVSIYIMVLTIMFLRRGIKALDVYLSEHNKSNI